MQAVSGPPIAPVTFDNEGCRDTYDHSHSVSAPAGACNAGAAPLKVVAEDVKVAKATKVAVADGEAKVGEVTDQLAD